MIDGKAQERIWSKVSRKGPADCWLWTGNKNSKGYGRYMFPDRSSVQAHRLVFAMTNGGMPDSDLDHLCRNRACCNPAHLEPVSNRENALRGIGPSAINAAKEVCDNGHPLSGDNLSLLAGRDAIPARRCKRCHADRQIEYRARRRALNGEVK